MNILPCMYSPTTSVLVNRDLSAVIRLVTLEQASASYCDQKSDKMPCIWKHNFYNNVRKGIFGIREGKHYTGDYIKF